MSISAGTLIGRYEVRSRLGAGGMGEVYLAQDNQLRRPVALKLLSENLTRDASLLRRFEQEALAASALNHPNILTVYEIGQINGDHFIATEFIDGVTLRELMAKETIDVPRALDIALQVCSALEAAHKAGMIHRDIKPENIMVRSDGIVKVLDFGLAKLTQTTEETLPEDATRKQVLTEAGMIMGTVKYMSPEQARGQSVDARSDIWSFGVVLYEMIVGRSPFAGPTTSDILAEVLKVEPPPLTDFLPDVSAELQRIIKKTLRKNREERYQAIKEVAIDLKNLRRQLEIEAELGQSHRSGSMERAQVTGGRNLTEGETVMLPAAHTEEISLQQQNLSAAPQKSLRGWKPILIAALLLVVIGAAGYGAYRFFAGGSAKKLTIAYQTMKVTPLTTTAKVFGATISPDGKYVAHVVNDAGKRSMWVRQVATTSDVQIIPPSEANYSGLTFSQDGNFIYYLMSNPGEPFAALYQIPVLGGTARKILQDVGSRISFSPDQKQFAFARTVPNTGEYFLMTANADGSGENKLTSRKSPEWLGPPVWSPNGKTILFTAWAEQNLTKIVEYDVSAKAEKVFGDKKWQSVSRAVWTPDGNGLIISAIEQGTQNPQIYYLSYPDAELQRITNDSNNYGVGGLTDDANTLLAIKGDRLSEIWLTTDVAKAEAAKQITSSKYDGCCGISWTPDGRIVFASTASGSHDIWIISADGSNKKQLTSGAKNNVYPVVAADGKTIVFVSDRSGTYEIWRMDIDGGSPAQLTRDKNVSSISLTPDDRWILYSAAREGKYVLWKMPFEGGEPTQITQTHTAAPSISPDGKTMVYYYWDQQSNKPKVAIADFETGGVKRSFELPPTAGGVVNWLADGKTLAYVDTRGGVSNIWTQPAEGGNPKQLTDFKNNLIFHYQWSRDGKQLALSRGTISNDVVLISNFKQ